MDNSGVAETVESDLDVTTRLLIDDKSLGVNRGTSVRRKFGEMTKKVILIRANPRHWSDLDRAVVGTPISLMAIGAVLKEANVPVEIIDFSVLTKEEEADAINNLVARDDIFLVGFTIMSVQVGNTLKIIKRLKEVNPEVRTIVGGMHAVLFPEETCSHELIDYVCYADGEELMLDLVDHLYYERDGYPTDIPALLYKKDGVVHKNPQGPLPEINDLPYQPYELLDMDRYIHRTWHPTDLSTQTRYFDILTGKGCPFRCTFCINALENFYDREYRGMTGDRILDEIEYLQEKYDAKHFKFVDELFFVNRNRLHDFLDGLEKRKLKFTWTTNIRADYFTRAYVDDKMLKRLKDSGCKFLTMGVESGSQRMLDFMKKDLKLESIHASARALAKMGITGGYSFMYGLPGETREDTEATFKMIGELYDIHPDLYVFGPQIFRPYPGNTLYDLCVEMGFPEVKELEDWDRDYDKDFGHAQEQEYTWVDKPEELAYVGFYGKMAYMGISRGRGLVLGRIQRLLSKFAKYRFEKSFYAFPIEYFLFTKLWGKISSSRISKTLPSIKEWNSLSCQSGGAEYSTTM